MLASLVVTDSIFKRANHTDKLFFISKAGGGMKVLGDIDMGKLMHVKGFAAILGGNDLTRRSDSVIDETIPELVDYRNFHIDVLVFVILTFGVTSEKTIFQKIRQELTSKIL